MEARKRTSRGAPPEEAKVARLADPPTGAEVPGKEMMHKGGVKGEELTAPPMVEVEPTPSSFATEA